MLVLTGFPFEGKRKFHIGDDIEVTILNVDRRSGQVKLGFTAPGLSIDREIVRAGKVADSRGGMTEEEFENRGNR